jgi:hypothetical protein
VRVNRQSGARSAEHTHLEVRTGAGSRDGQAWSRRSYLGPANGTGAAHVGKNVVVLVHYQGGLLQLMHNRRSLEH